MTTAGAADVEVRVFVAGGVVVLVGAADPVGTALVAVVVRRVVLVVAAVLVPAVVDSSSPDEFGGAEVVVSDAVEFSSGEVRVVVGESSEVGAILSCVPRAEACSVKN